MERMNMFDDDYEKYEEEKYNLAHSGDCGEYSSLYFQMTFKEERENNCLLNNLKKYGKLIRCMGPRNLEGLFTGQYESEGILDSDNWDYECKLIAGKLNVNGSEVKSDSVTVFVYSFDDDPNNGFDFLIVRNFKDDKSISIISITTDKYFEDVPGEDRYRSELVDIIEKSFTGKISTQF